MADEERFYNLMLRDQFDIVLPFKTYVDHPQFPGKYVEIDNIGQKKDVVFVFEGSKGEPDLSQIKSRFFLVRFNRWALIEAAALKPFRSIRVFYYSFSRRKKKGRLLEFDEQGSVIKMLNFTKDEELVKILSNL